jgi:hypothetical protein
MHGRIGTVHMNLFGKLAGTDHFADLGVYESNIIKYLKLGCLHPDAFIRSGSGVSV